MAEWTAFAGVAGAVLVLILFLTRLSAMQLEAATATSSSAVESAELATSGSRPDPSESGSRPDPSDPGTATERDVGVTDEASSNGGRVDVKAMGERGDAPAARTAYPGDPIHPDEFGELSSMALLVNVTATQGVFLTVLVGAALLFRIPWAAFGDAVSPGLVGVGVAAGVGLYVANQLAGSLADVTGVGHDERLREVLAPESAGEWLVLLVVVLPVIAGFEELLFRGILIGVLASGFGLSPWALAAVSSVFFGLAHSAQGGTGMVVTGVLGVVLAAVFVVTGSLFAVVVAHYVLNGLEFVVHEAVGIEWAPGRT